MATNQLSNDAPATSLFPQFENTIYQWVSVEVQGLTDAQLDFESDQWEWSKWSIRRNLSHLASGDLRWIWNRWGKVLFPKGLAKGEEYDRLLDSPFDRRLDENLYWEPEALLEKLTLGLDLCWSVLSSETVGSLRSKELESPATGLFTKYPQLFPGGVRPVPGDSTKVYINLETTFLHRYYEFTTHLFNVQRLKRAQGVSGAIEIPADGYWVLPEWDRSEA